MPKVENKSWSGKTLNSRQGSITFDRDGIATVTDEQVALVKGTPGFTLLPETPQELAARAARDSDRAQAALAAAQAAAKEAGEAAARAAADATDKARALAGPSADSVVEPSGAAPTDKAKK